MPFGKLWTPESEQFGGLWGVPLDHRVSVKLRTRLAWRGRGFIEHGAREPADSGTRAGERRKP